MSKYVLDNRVNFHLQLLGHFKRHCSFCSGVFFIAAACSTYREVKLGMKNHVTIVHNYKCICINTELRQTTNNTFCTHTNYNITHCLHTDEEFRARKPSHLEQFTSHSANRNHRRSTCTHCPTAPLQGGEKNFSGLIYRKNV